MEGQFPSEKVPESVFEVPKLVGIVTKKKTNAILCNYINKTNPKEVYQHLVSGPKSIVRTYRVNSFSPIEFAMVLDLDPKIWVKGLTVGYVRDTKATHANLVTVASVTLSNNGKINELVMEYKENISQNIWNADKKICFFYLPEHCGYQLTQTLSSSKHASLASRNADKTTLENDIPAFPEPPNYGSSEFRNLICDRLQTTIDSEPEGKSILLNLENLLTPDSFTVRATIETYTLSYDALMPANESDWMTIYKQLLHNSKTGKAKSVCFGGGHYPYLFKKGNIRDICNKLSAKAKIRWKTPCTDYLAYHKMQSNDTFSIYNGGNKNIYGIPYFWCEAKSFKNAHFYISEDQIFWESIVYTTALAEILTPLPPLYVPLLAGDMFRVYRIIKDSQNIRITFLYAGWLRDREASTIWNKVLSYAQSVGTRLASSMPKANASKEGFWEDPTNEELPGSYINDSFNEESIKGDYFSDEDNEVWELVPMDLRITNELTAANLNKLAIIEKIERDREMFDRGEYIEM